ncbi:MAG: nucleoside triphosphate pyrophosphohydrolase, partial [Bacteroidia bacterium]|nr:nucleoside triphosphate pyrophosphohydrolase [Bacteroidia bacterium]
MEAFSKLKEIIAELRQRCPWDRSQTFESLIPLTWEEVYELIA